MPGDKQYTPIPNVHLDLLSSRMFMFGEGVGTFQNVFVFIGLGGKWEGEKNALFFYRSYILLSF